MDAKDLFPPSEYLRSEDVMDAGGEMQLQISKIERKEYQNEGKSEVKGLLSFMAIEKKLTTNVTNTQTLISMFGDKNIDVNWIGKTVTLYVDHNVKNPKGGIMDGIRIRLIDPKQDVITAFWTEARRRGFTQNDGRDHVKKFDGDFEKALQDLLSNPF